MRFLGVFRPRLSPQAAAPVRRARSFRPDLLNAVLEDRNLLASFSWIGSNNGVWSNVANWQMDGNAAIRLPGPQDDVTVDKSVRK
jgi:hypothetical protein